MVVGRVVETTALAATFHEVISIEPGGFPRAGRWKITSL
jgi:hypothetical protein